MPDQINTTPEQGTPYQPAQQPAPTPQPGYQDAETLPQSVTPPQQNPEPQPSLASPQEAQEQASEPKIIDRRPVQRPESKPLPLRLVGTDVIKHELSFVTERTAPDGGKTLERWWLPDATRALECLSTEKFMEAADSAVGAEIGIAFAALAASDVDEDTAKALIELPMYSTGLILGKWQSMANREGTTAGESSSSAPA